MTEAAEAGRDMPRRPEAGREMPRRPEAGREMPRKPDAGGDMPDFLCYKNHPCPSTLTPFLWHLQRIQTHF